MVFESFRLLVVLSMKIIDTAIVLRSVMRKSRSFPEKKWIFDWQSCKTIKFRVKLSIKTNVPMVKFQFFIDVYCVKRQFFNYSHNDMIENSIYMNWKSSIISTIYPVLSVPFSASLSLSFCRKAIFRRFQFIISISEITLKSNNFVCINNSICYDWFAVYAQRGAHKIRVTNIVLLTAMVETHCGG